MCVPCGLFRNKLSWNYARNKRDEEIELEKMREIESRFLMQLDLGAE
jgi:hypothetical protein